MDTILITGGTGLIGTSLTKALTEKGYKVIILTRNVEKNKPLKNVTYASWNVEKQYIDPEAIKKSQYIIHLAGENVASKKWTEERKKEILESRIKAGSLLIKALKDIPNNIKAVVSASAIGWYGSDPQIPNPKPFVETLLPSQDFLGRTCEQWESSIMPVNNLGKRLVILRTGIVLSNDGGAYTEFKKTL
ncbi:MAG TPA: NAD-dependent epimerase/dehydratase family protein, partial [Flavisolibacter sp.]|nr:NAD-dependent epimerase/dehydratase family protein [Flavisolibacter sp.]